MTDDLRGVFDKAIQRSRDRSWIPGRLGRLESDGSYTIRVSGRDGWVHVRKGINGQQGTTIARNLGVAETANMPIKMRREHGDLVVREFDERAIYVYTGGGPPGNVGPHTHRRGSGLDYEMEVELLDAGRVKYESGMVVYITPFRYQKSDGTWSTWLGGTLDLSIYQPSTAGNWSWVLVGVDPSTNTAVAVKGTEYSYFSPLTLDLIDDISFSSYIPCGAVKVREDDTTLNDWRDYEDAHGWFTGAGPSSGFDISVLTEELTPDAGADYVAIYDTSEGAHNKVRLDKLPTAYQLLFSQTQDVTIANTVTETTLLGGGRGTTTIPADTLEVGSTVRIKAYGNLSDTGAPTLDIKVTLGGAEVASTGAQTLNNTVTESDWSMEVLITCRSTGGSGTVVAGGLFEHDSGSQFGLVKTGATAADTTGGLAVDVTATWGTASASNTITVQIATIEVIEPPTTVVAPTTGDGLLLETGDFVLLETSDYLLLE